MKNNLLLAAAILCLVSVTVSLVTVKAFPFLKKFAILPVGIVQAKIAQPILITPLVEMIYTKPIISPKSSPAKIIIPGISLDLPIAEGSIVDDQWTLYDDKASWLSTSETPGRGNVILYAHNKQGLFGGLNGLKAGDLISVEHDGKLYSYVMTELRYVSPTQVDAILADNDQLTLYTCNGAFDQKRLVVTAVPAKS